MVNLEMSTRGSVSLARHANTASPGPTLSPFLLVYFFFFVTSLPDEARICKSSIRIANPKEYSYLRGEFKSISLPALLDLTYIVYIYIVLCKRSTKCYLLILPPLLLFAGECLPHSIATLFDIPTLPNAQYCK